MDTVFVVLLRRCTKDPNPPWILTLLDRALITEDNPFPVCLIPILMLLSPGKTLSNMVFSQKGSLLRPPLPDVLLGKNPLDGTHGRVGSNLVGQLAKR